MTGFCPFSNESHGDEPEILAHLAEERELKYEAQANEDDYDPVTCDDIIDSKEKVENQMLVFARGIGQSIVVNKNIEITIIGYNNRGDARIAIDAPPEITIDRKEVHIKKILSENLLSTNPVDNSVHQIQ